MVTASSPRSSELMLPAIKSAASRPADESKEQLVDEATGMVVTGVSSAVGIQSHYHAVTNAAQQLVQTFDQSQLHFAETVESVYHQLREVLHRTRHSGPLSRTRIDACVQLLLALAAASPQSALLTPLVNNLVAAVYTTPPSPATRITSATLASTATYFEQVKLLHRKQQLLFRDLQRISAQVEYFDRNGGGHREALVIAIRKWQIELMRTALLGWRENVRTFTIQRTRMRDLLATWERKGRVRRMRWSMRLWKMSVMRRERRDLTPQVEAARAHSAELSQQIDDTESAIEQSQLRLGTLLDEMNEISGQCTSVADRVRQLQDKIERYACFRLSDVAHSVLELAREMMLSLQDELEFGRDVYRYDPYRMLAATVATEGKKGSGSAKSSGKRGKEGKKRSKDKSQREREEEEEKERRLLLSLDTHKYEQRLSEMSEQDLLLLWLNYHIQRNVRRNGLDPHATHSKYNIENFTTDTRDSLALLVLCEEITPKPYLRPQLLEVREELDSEQRARLLLAIVHDFDADAAGVLSGEVVVHASGSDMVGCFVGKLFCHWFGVDSVKGVVEEQLAGLSALRREWEAMTTRVHKLKQKMREREMVYKKQRQHIYNERKHNHDAADDLNAAVDDSAASVDTTAANDATNPADSLASAPPSDAADPASATIVEGSQFLDQLPPDEATQYTRYAERFLVSFLRLYRDARYTLDRLKHGHDTYITLQSRIQRYTLNLLVQRYQGKPAVLINYKEKRDRETMCTVHVGHFADIGMTEEDRDGLQLELTAQFSELRKVFRYYSSNEWEHGSSLSLKDVMQLCTDCKLTAGTITTKSTASTAAASTSAAQLALKGGYEAIFNQCALPVDNHRGTSTATPSATTTSTDSSTVGGGSDTLDETMEITPAAFIELLIRIAYNKYKSTDTSSTSSSASASAASASAGPTVSLAEKLSMLLRHYVLKNARKLDSEGFRMRYGNGEFSEMLRRHKKKVKKLFEVCAQKTYLKDNLPTNASTNNAGSASASGGSGGGDGLVADELSELAAQSTSSLSVAVEVSQLLHILRGVKIVGGEGGMTLDEFYTCVSHCRKSDFITAPGIIGPLEELRMEYGEFVELLIAIACYRYPDPYTPLVQRVDNFLGRELNIVFK